MVDRKKGPKINSIEKICVPDFNVHVLSNGTRLAVVNLGTQALTHIEILHKGSRFLEAQKGTAKAAARLIKEGTASYSSEEIANLVDYYGASMSTGANLDYTFVKLFSMTKYLPNLLPVLHEIVYQPTFEESELTKFIENSKERLKIDMAKNEVVAYRTLTEQLYGSDHPYGYNSSNEIYGALTRESIQNHHRDAYGADNTIIILSGKVTAEILDMIEQYFGQEQRRSTSDISVVPNQGAISRISINTQEKSQSSIKLGMPLFNRTHEDYMKFYVLNTILGGYFGSRLMKSIREDKGYTYGIYSSMDMMIHDGYLSISTDVTNEHINATIDEVYAQIDRLMTVLVEPKELQMVKNYINGSLLNMIDGPFRVASMVKAVMLNDLDHKFYHQLSRTVTAITAEEVHQLAKKYFSGKTMIEVIVGNPD